MLYESTECLKKSNSDKECLNDLEDRVNVPDGAAALAAADGVVRRVIGAWALEIFLQGVIFNIIRISHIKFRI